MQKLCLSAFCALAAVTSVSQAAFVAVDNFDARTLGPVHGQNGWVHGDLDANADEGTADVVLDPAGGTNRVLAASQTGSNGAVDLDRSVGAVSGSGTLFYRFRYVAPIDATTAVSDISFGMSDEAAPGGFGSFEPMVGTVNVASGAVLTPHQLRVRNGTGGTTTEFSTSADTWYSVWQVIDNATDTYQVYVGGGDFGAQTQLAVGAQTSFAFRNAGAGAVGDLISVYLRAGGSHRGPFYLDDIYLDSTSVNLSNPVPEPATLGVAAAGALLVMGHRRRR